MHRSPIVIQLLIAVTSAPLLAIHLLASVKFKIMSEKTLLVVVKGNSFGSSDDASYHLLVAETGEHLASHICSHEGYAKSDLYTGRQERIKEFTERFGEIEVKHLSETDITESELFERNKKWYEETSKNDEVSA
jgi:hypothetical protein